MARKWDVTDEEVRQALENNAGVITAAAASLGVPRKTFSNWVHNLVVTTDQAPDSTLNLKIKKSGRYVVTCAQNNTLIHKPFIRALERYCDYMDAQLIVLPIRYKNVNAYINKDDTDCWWPEELTPYYLNRGVDLNENLRIDEIKVAATAVSPLSGLENIAGHKSAIVGHPRVQLKMVATPTWMLPKQLLTTGSCSLKNYSISKVGKKAHRYHTTGAVLIGVKGDLFWTRQLTANDKGCFYDLDTFYSPDEEPVTGVRVAGISLGDTHNDFMAEGVKKATWGGPDSIMAVLNPERIYLHDLFDGHTVSPHNRNDLYSKFEKFCSKTNSVSEELDRVVSNWNTLWGRQDAEIYVIRSNHNDWLTRWLNDIDPRQDLENAILHYELQLAMLHGIKKTGKRPDPLEVYLRPRIINPHRAHFPKPGERVEVCGIAILHGDKGANGAKPSILSYSKCGIKIVFGHGHQSAKEGDATSSGTNSELLMGYNNDGLSSWIQSNTVIYQDGNTSIYTIIGDEWREYATH